MKEFYDFLKENDLTPNGHYVLYCMRYNIPIENINHVVEQYKLSLSGYVKEEYDSIENVKFYLLTKKAVHLVHESEIYICNIKQTKKVNKVSFENWEDNIKEYNSLFPKGKKKGSVVSFRTNPKELYDIFKWFFTEYPEYTWEDVLDATKNYLSTFEESCDYTYAQTSKYFIKKSDKNKVVMSTLATLIYNIKEGNNEEISSGTYYFGP